MMRHYGRGRTRKRQKIDSDMLHDIETRHVDNKARERFRRKPYSSYGVEDCLKKWGVDLKGGVDGGRSDPLREKREVPHTVCR